MMKFSFLFLVMMHYCMCIENEIYQWGTSSTTVLNEALSLYEICVLGLKPDEYDIKNTVFNQPKCKHLIDSFQSNLPKRCWLGALHQPHDDGICVGVKMKGDVNKDRKCLHLSDKKGLWNSWMPANSSSHDNSDNTDKTEKTCKVTYRKYPGQVAAFIQAVMNSSFEIIAFAGDSMAVQISQRMACATLRGNMSMQQYGDLFSLRPSGASVLLQENPGYDSFQSCENRNLKKSLTKDTDVIGQKMSQKKSLMLTAYKYMTQIGKSDFKQRKQFSIPDIEKKCGLPFQNMTCRREVAEAHIYKSLMEDFKVGKKWSDTLHLLILPVAIKYEWEFIPVAKALNNLAKSIFASNSRILVLSPFSQHFPYHPQGLYINQTKIIPNQSVCVPHKIPYDKSSVKGMHIDSINFQIAMTDINPKWRDSIGFFEGLTTASSSWHDLHPEAKSYGWSVDCTHYTFQPLMFEEIWQSLSEYIKQDHVWKIGVKSTEM